jgi:anti-anti-sigma regulatory factor
MAARDKKKLVDHTLAGPDQETGNQVTEAEVMPADEGEEQLVAGDGDINSEVDASDSLPEEQILEAAAPEEAAESVITLNATSTIQHVFELYEKLKKSYSANNVIEINASHVSSIDTSTLQLLVALKKDAIKRQKEVIFTEPSRRFIESAGLLGVLDILDIEV